MVGYRNFGLACPHDTIRECKSCPDSRFERFHLQLARVSAESQDGVQSVGFRISNTQMDVHKASTKHGLCVSICQSMRDANLTVIFVGKHCIIWLHPW